ncbi:MAG: hypothetical protein GF400_10855 [Candidatus Eisenbacteria bacterium]|nr:hypothetical protein [Candidatus Eisenbacteria bacterium]
MSFTAKALGVGIPVVVATSLCLSVPFMLLLADAAILGAAVVLFVSERGDRSAADATLPELE